MNFIIIFFDPETKTVLTRYYGSKFLSYSNAKALKQSFDKALEKRDKKVKTGHNVNWAVFKVIEEERKVEKNPSLISIESCILHIVHVAFKDEAKNLSGI